MNGAVLVTGANGFIGRALCARLDAGGIPVRRATRFPDAARGDARVADIGPDTDWSAALEGCAAVVHLANIAHAAVDPVRLERVNVQGSAALARQAAAAGARRFIYMSSIKAQAPDDAYGEAKRAAEHALAAIGGLEFVALRPPLVYGPGVGANFLALMRAIDRGLPLPLAGIENRRSIVYAGNLADAVACALLAPQAAGRTYAVSDGESMSTPQLCRAIGEALGRPARLFRFPSRLLELLPGARKLTRSLEVDAAAIRDELGWKPPYTSAHGLSQTARWYREASR